MSKPIQVVSDADLKQFSSATTEQAFSGTSHTGRTDDKKKDCKNGQCKC